MIIIVMFHVIKSEKIAVVSKIEAGITITWRIEASIWADKGGVSVVNVAYLIVV